MLSLAMDTVESMSGRTGGALVQPPPPCPTPALNVQITQWIAACTSSLQGRLPA